ncbi:MAG: RluA family pseudouridine synthase [Acidobacteria bacterium]|nr:RluA family pseudouridine synthase [Acidobacteriota bacterium]
MPAPTEPVRFEVPAGQTRTLASLVREQLGLSHREAKELVESGRVVIDGQPVLDAVKRPRAGVTIEVLARAATRPAPPPPRLSGPGFRTLHLDAVLLVVDKDSGVVTIPTPDSPEDTSLVARVLGALAVAGHRGRNLWVVHRIDRETSGLVVFARTDAAARSMRAQFRARKPLREYIAWTQGLPDPPAGTLTHMLREDEQSRRVSVVRGGRDAREAILQYEVEASRGEPSPRARVRVTLVTGRRNQIRVQFAGSGWPLLGDRFYGARDRGPGRTALHAARLEFLHPQTRQPLAFVSPLPEDLRELDRALFGRRASS